MDHQELKSRICDIISITEDKFQLAKVLSVALNSLSLKKDLTGMIVRYHSGGGYSSSYVTVVYPQGIMGDVKLPDVFYVKNSDGEKFKISRELTTFGGGHGEGCPQPGTTMEIYGVNGYNSNYRDRELTIITQQEALV
ncbi:hypothetical protein HPMBJEAJ_00416 [Aeromonas phage avDM6]|nr:hypothetical protein HPMBJEAJ_00416 [Aeromonas phage avDM6]